MIHVDALDFSEWHSEEVMFLLTLSVYKRRICKSKIIDGLVDSRRNTSVCISKLVKIIVVNQGAHKFRFILDICQALL